MKAMRELPRFYSEARAIMDRHDLPNDAFENVHASLMHKAYMQESEPLLKQICSITALAMPSSIRHADGTLENLSDGLTDEMRECVLQLRTQIAKVKFDYFGGVTLYGCR